MLMRTILPMIQRETVYKMFSPLCENDFYFTVREIRGEIE